MDPELGPAVLVREVVQNGEGEVDEGFWVEGFFGESAGCGG
jgi:hypothetical protein